MFWYKFPSESIHLRTQLSVLWFIMQSSEGRLLTTQKWSSMQNHCHHQVKQAIFKIPRHLLLVLLSDPSLYELNVWTLINRWVDWLLILWWMRWQSNDDVTSGTIPFPSFKSLKKSNNTYSSLPKFIFFWSHPEKNSLLIYFFFVIDGQDGHECHMHETNERLAFWTSFLDFLKLFDSIDTLSCAAFSFN